MRQTIFYLALLALIVLVSANVSVDVSVELAHPNEHHHQPHHPEHHAGEHSTEEDNESQVDMVSDRDNTEKESDTPMDILPIVGDSPRAPINHGKSGVHYGVDVARYQRITSYTKVVAALRKMGQGSDPFCIVKTTEGAGYVFADAEKHVKGFQAAGCLTGVYHFFHANAGVDAQIKRILTHRHGAKYVVLDAELDERNAGPAALAVLKGLEKAGIKPILYSNAGMIKKWKAEKWPYPMWIARYSSNKPVVRTDLWQYSEKGRVDGIVGKVDLDKSICSKQRFEEIFY